MCEDLFLTATFFTGRSVYANDSQSIEMFITIKYDVDNATCYCTLFRFECRILSYWQHLTSMDTW